MRWRKVSTEEPTHEEHVAEQEKFLLLTSEMADWIGKELIKDCASTARFLELCAKAKGRRPTGD